MSCAQQNFKMFIRSEVRIRITRTIPSQGRNQVRWRPGQEAILAPPCSNLKSFRSKCTVLMKVLVTMLGLLGAPIVIRRSGIVPPWPPRSTPVPSAYYMLSFWDNVLVSKRSMHLFSVVIRFRLSIMIQWGVTFLCCCLHTQNLPCGYSN